MVFRKVLSHLAVMTALAVVPASAQNAQSVAPAPPQPAAAAAQDGGIPAFNKPETPAQRATRLGTAEDPGPDPDPKTIYWRFGKKYTIHRFERRWAVYDVQDGWVRPFAPVNFAKELYQQNEKYVWVWSEERDPATEQENSDAAYSESNPEEIKYFEMMRSEFSELTPPASNVRLRFEESSAGLPGSGSWRNTLAVADMNGDGFQDLILPPQRGPEGTPSIFLGDGKGGWKLWQVEWPFGFTYGGVVAADFNKDKKMDLAFAVHLTGVIALIGDGKGKFTESATGLPRDFPTRRIATLDVDADGWLDIVTLSEGPVAQGPEVRRTPGGSLRAYLNRKGKSWEQRDIAPQGKYLGGDWLASGNFNGDKTPDFIASSIYFNGVDTAWMSGRDGKTWSDVTDRGVIPFLSYYYANVAGRFSKAKTDDAIVSYFRQWPDDLNPRLIPTPPTTTLIGIDRISFAGKEPKRNSIIRWGSGRGVWGMGKGDFDGDGNQDVFYTLFDPREARLLVGDGQGSFRTAVVEGIKLPSAINYDLTVADLNGDKRPDVVVMYESDEVSAFGAKNGRVQVFLNRGPSVAVSAK